MSRGPDNFRRLATCALLAFLFGCAMWGFSSWQRRAPEPELVLPPLPKPTLLYLGRSCEGEGCAP